LMEMLTSESENNTTLLENEIKKELSSSFLGGGNKSHNMNKLMESLSETDMNTTLLENEVKKELSSSFSGGGNNSINNMQNIKKYFLDFKNKGVDVKLNNMSITDFFNNIDNSHDKSSKLVSSGKSTNNNHFIVENNKSSLNSISEMHTTESTDKLMDNINDLLIKYNMSGGKKKDKSAKESSTRKANPGFIAFNELKTHIKNKLNIKSIIEASIIAKEVKNEVSTTHNITDGVQLAKKSIEYFDQNTSKFEKLYKKLYNK
jgi:hypothetical protein